jgi:hypothetical protein
MPRMIWEPDKPDWMGCFLAVFASIAAIGSFCFYPCRTLGLVAIGASVLATLFIVCECSREK